jgi:uncharacterized protein (TIGR02001 family)
MNKLVMSVVAAATMCGSTALAADMPVKARPAPAVVAENPWDVAFGGALMSDYNFRGISQSDRGPSVTAYMETRYKVNANFVLYAGSQYYAVDLPTHPSCECDFYAGFRPTVGDFAFDFGFIYYYYPRERQVFLTGAFPSPATFEPTPNIWTLSNTDFWEVYGKVAWDVVKDRFALGGNVYYSPSWLNSDAYGLFASATAKVTFQAFTLPIFGATKEIGWYLSAEVGRYWLGTSNALLGSVNYPDYWTWNVGLAFTHKVFTFDFRYYDTDLSKEECFTNTGDLRGLPGGNNPVGTSKWCSPTFIVATKFDLTVSDNLK